MINFLHEIKFYIFPHNYQLLPSFHFYLLNACSRIDPFKVSFRHVAGGANVATIQCWKGKIPAKTFH